VASAISAEEEGITDDNAMPFIAKSSTIQPNEVLNPIM
jgi:hypothetical protein